MVEDKRNLKNNFGRDENENEKENTGRTGVDYEFSFQKGGRGPENYTPPLHRGGLSDFSGGIFWENILVLVAIFKRAQKFCEQ